MDDFLYIVNYNAELRRWADEVAAKDEAKKTVLKKQSKAAARNLGSLKLWHWFSGFGTGAFGALAGFFISRGNTLLTASCVLFAVVFLLTGELIIEPLMDKSYARR